MVYKFFYFPLRALGDSCRMILNHSGEKWEDIHVTNWDQTKSGSVFGKLPMLDVNGKKYGESMAIARFLGKKFGLTGATPEEDLRLDSMADAVKDLTLDDLKAFWGAHKDTDKTKKVFDEARTAFPQKYKFVEQQLGTTPGAYILGDKKITWADFVLYGFWNMSAYLLRTDFTSTPNIRAHYLAMQALPSNKAYMEKTKDMKVTPHIIPEA